MTTLAGMTPQERAQCRGMWCENEDGVLCIYNGDRIEKAWLSICFHPAREGFSAVPPDSLIPCFDLPRAWTAGGTPPQGDWEDDYTDSDGSTLTTGEDLDLGPHQEIRRWIGEWEEA